MGWQVSHFLSTANSQSQSWQLRRRALTVFEVTLAFTLLAIVLAATVRMAGVVADHRRASERKEVALQAAQAVSEQIGNIPWDVLTTDAANQISIPGPLAAQLPNSKCTITLTDETNPTTKRVLVQINSSSHGQAPTAQLTTWVFPE